MLVGTHLPIRSARPTPDELNRLLRAIVAMPLKTERSHPPHFAGRQDELARLVAHVRAVVEVPAEAQAGMGLIDGVQGVGKTALLNELAAKAGGNGVVVLRVSTGGLRDPAALFVRMLTGVGMRRAKAETLASLRRTTSTMKTGFSGLGGSRVVESPPRGGRDIGTLLTDTKDERLWRGSGVLVLVDEIQNIDDAGMRALASLHEGVHGCPVAVVGAGLQHALSVLANSRPNISRPALRITLGPLAMAETEDAIGIGLKNLGYHAGDEAVASLAAASHGFPHHIWCYLAGAERAIEAHGALNTEAALRHALDEGSKRRIDYYWDRLRSMEHATPGAFQPLLAIAAAMAATDDTRLTHREAIAAIAAQTTQAEEARAILNNALAKGVLTTERSGALSFGIPSFHAFMQGELPNRERQRGERAHRRS